MNGTGSKRRSRLRNRCAGSSTTTIIEAAIAAIRQQIGATDREQRRRLVTVLFADLRGFTAMSETLDAEILADLMNDLWRRVDAIINDHGGHVDKHMGDAVMAVWGMDGTHEHDAELAVRAGLALQDAVRDTTAAHETGIDLSARVGINTGHALIGTVGSADELTVMGDTVNVASRLEQAAPAGGVLIAHDTYNHVRGVFDVSPANHSPYAARPTRSRPISSGGPNNGRSASRPRASKGSRLARSGAIASRPACTRCSNRSPPATACRPAS